MLKYLCLFICMATCLTFLAGCKVNNSISSVNAEIEKASGHSNATDWQPTTYKIVNNFHGVTMTVKKGTASASKLTVVLENNSGSQCTYGEYYKLEKRINDQWYQVPVTFDGDYGFNSIGYNLFSGDAQEWTVDWNWLYGNLGEGEYRIVKDILDFRGTSDYDTYFLSAEFTITN